MFVTSHRNAVVVCGSHQAAVDLITRLRSIENPAGLFFEPWTGGPASLASLASDALVHADATSGPESDAESGTGSLFTVLDVDDLPDVPDNEPQESGPTKAEIEAERRRVAAREAGKIARARQRAKERALKEQAEIAKIARKAEKARKRCRKKKCKESVILDGYVCSVCKLKFCVEHRLPESHGCGKQMAKSSRTAHKKKGEYDLAYMRRTGDSQPPPKLSRAELKAKARKAKEASANAGTTGKKKGGGGGGGGKKKKNNNKNKKAANARKLRRKK